VDLLERIIAYITANVGTTFSGTSIAKYFKSENRAVSPETILNYIKACEGAYLFYRIKRQDLQGKKILASNEKYYIADHGIREAVFGGNMRDINLILENIVCMELLRRGYDVTVGKSATREIDFVCVKQGKKLYVQVAYLLASEDTIEREFGAYENSRDNFPKYVVSLDDFDMSRDGIKHVVSIIVRPFPIVRPSVETPVGQTQLKAVTRQEAASIRSTWLLPFLVYLTAMAREGGRPYARTSEIVMNETVPNPRRRIDITD
jgi:predicted AAA+ superfamily ATPase